MITLILLVFGHPWHALGQGTSDDIENGRLLNTMDTSIAKTAVKKAAEEYRMDRLFTAIHNQGYQVAWLALDEILAYPKADQARFLAMAFRDKQLFPDPDVVSANYHYSMTIDFVQDRLVGMAQSVLGHNIAHRAAVLSPAEARGVATELDKMK